MTAVKTLAGEKLLIKIGDGGSPTETFTHDCLINADRSAQMSSDVTDVIVPDCDDSTLPGWKYRFKDGLEVTVSGAGKMHTASLETWWNWFNSDTAKNVRIETNGITGANGGGYIAGAFKLTSFNWSGARKDFANTEVTLVSHGACAWTDLA
jgi:hypothetical protein